MSIPTPAQERLNDAVGLNEVAGLIECYRVILERSGTRPWPDIREILFNCNLESEFAGTDKLRICAKSSSTQGSLKMKTSYVFAAACLIGLSVSGCVTMSTTDAMVPLQNETAKMIGLSSSDELTITNVNSGKPDALGGQTYTYTATTKGGRILDCSALMTPGIIGAPPTISTPTCNAVKSHN